MEQEVKIHVPETMEKLCNIFGVEVAKALQDYANALGKHPDEATANTIACYYAAWFFCKTDTVQKSPFSNAEIEQLFEEMGNCRLTEQMQGLPGMANAKAEWERWQKKWQKRKEEKEKRKQ